MVFLSQRRRTKPTFRPEVDRAHPLSLGLVGCWLFNEGRQANDLIYGINGVWNGTPAVGYGSAGVGAGCSSGNNITFTSVIKPQQKIGSGDYTIACFLQHTNTTGTQNYYRKDSPTGTRNIYLIRASGTTIEFGDGIFSSITAAHPNLLAPTWIVGTRNITSGAHALYFDGRVVNTGSFTSGTDLETGNGEWGFGYDTFAGITAEPFVGTLFQLMLWNRELSAAQVKWLYEQPYDFLKPIMPRSYPLVTAGGGGGTFKPFMAVQNNSVVGAGVH
jgi:hypothetical protein